ncbi:hypothetical protein [Paenibacillus sp. 22594]|uniref:hypothetical protein n=1 Tax=Paenibacillus sp. 22594 TaxID=3453947 RepID=UPI003F84F03A
MDIESNIRNILLHELIVCKGGTKQLLGRGDAVRRAILPRIGGRTPMSTDQLIALLVLVIMIVQLAVGKKKS